jgi:hypothetical protein
MKNLQIVSLIFFLVVVFASDVFAQKGYFAAPYIRNEADSATLSNASITAKSFVQSNLQSEASHQVCVTMSTANASVEWAALAAALWQNIEPLSCDKISVESFSSAADLSVEFKVARDATNLYLLVDDTDDVLRNDGAANWQKDAVEIFIDRGNDKLGAYVPNNYLQYTFVYGVSTPKSGLTYAQITKDGNLGYVFEILIPWPSLGGAPKDADFIGFDLQVDDNDTGTRNGKKAWNDDSDNAWKPTVVLGTLQIAACANTYHSNAIEAALGAQHNSNIYPNPFSDFTHLNLVTLNDEINFLCVFALNEKVQWTSTVSGTTTLSCGDQLSPGMCFLEVANGHSTRISKFI